MRPKDNPESWRQFNEFFAIFSVDDYWGMALDVVRSLEARGLAPLFRIGTSMYHIIFSTLEKHGLNTEPRVTLLFDPEEKAVCVAYSCTNWWIGEPMSEERVPLSVAVPTILRYLRRLWIETKPDTPIPEALNAPFSSNIVAPDGMAFPREQPTE